MSEIDEIIANRLEKPNVKIEIPKKKTKATKELGIKFFNPNFKKTIEDYTDNPLSILLLHPKLKLKGKHIHQIFDTRIIPYALDYFEILKFEGKGFDLTKILNHPIALLIMSVFERFNTKENMEQ